MFKKDLTLPPTDHRQEERQPNFSFSFYRNNLFHVSGTDIVRCLSFRFQAFGRPVKNSKKFEEGIFSDLRNLKSGTDASLEEPKSPFLDFLYKNNCIRTQKKQKVFYWYSVPHDRLFLDALERDLKREKMAQEATTAAVNEPALSFEFDSSHSLYDQITKAQQANTSSFSAHAAAPPPPPHGPPVTYSSHSSSPMVRPADSSMPPPPPAPQQMAPPAMPIVPEESNDPVMYNAVGLASSTSVSNNSMIKAEQDFAGALQYDRNGVPVSRIHQRHASMPTYVEYSPAPSFVSSQYDDYGNRGLSFEPVTPPQHALSLGSEPAYIANEDTGLYSAIPEIASMGAYHPAMQLPPSNLVGPQLSNPSRSFPSAQVYGYSALEGSPTYKQRRRRSSIPTSVTNAIAAATGNASTQQQRTSSQNTPQPHAAHRPSDLRRSCSVAQVPEDESSTQDSLPELTNGYTPQRTDTLQHSVSQTGMSLPPLDETASSHDRLNSMLSAAQGDASLVNGGETMESAALSSSANGRGGDRPGPVRRARSATMTELGPYPHKSHSCPIPSCGRLFKRLEHLKRYVSHLPC